MTGNDMTIKKDFAEIQEVKIEGNNDNELRVYCTQRTTNPEQSSFAFQIRTHGAINEFGNGKKRNMIATVNLTMQEMKQIMAYCKEAAI